MTDSSVFDPSESYTRQEERRALPRMLMDGTPGFAADPQRWMPPYSAEEQAMYADGRWSDYTMRVSRVVVEPFYHRAIKRHVATCLGKQVILKDDVPTEIRGTGKDARDGWWENVDQRGNDGNVFLRAVIEDAVGDAGFSTVLVDHPPVPPDFKLSDLDAASMRPFWRHYRARDVIGATPEVINGRERAAEVRLRECGKDDAGNDEEQVRILIAAPWSEADQSLVGWVTWETWARRKDQSGQARDVLVGEGNMQPHQEIPLEVLYFNRTGFFEALPPYEDLAYMNLKHTRQESILTEDMVLSCGAQLVRTGISKEESLQRVIGPKQLMWSGDAGATAAWLERSGTAAKTFMEYEDNLEAKMERIGNEPHTRRTGNETATASAIDAAKARTEVQVDVIAIRDFTETLLMSTAKYRGHDSGGSVLIETPPAHSDFTIDEIAAIKDAAAEGFIQHFRVAEALKLRGLIPDDVDPETESAAAQAEAPPPTTVKAQYGELPTDALSTHVQRVKDAIASADSGNAVPAEIMPPTPQAAPKTPAMPMSGQASG